MPPYYTVWDNTSLGSTTNALGAMAKDYISNNIFNPISFAIGLAIFIGLIYIVIRSLRSHRFRV